MCSKEFMFQNIMFKIWPSSLFCWCFATLVSQQAELTNSSDLAGNNLFMFYQRRVLIGVSMHLGRLESFLLLGICYSCQESVDLQIARATWVEREQSKHCRKAILAFSSCSAKEIRHSWKMLSSIGGG